MRAEFLIFAVPGIYGALALLADLIHRARRKYRQNRFLRIADMTLNGTARSRHEWLAAPNPLS